MVILYNKTSNKICIFSSHLSTINISLFVDKIDGILDFVTKYCQHCCQRKSKTSSKRPNVVLETLLNTFMSSKRKQIVQTCKEFASKTPFTKISSRPQHFGQDSRKNLVKHF